MILDQKSSSADDWRRENPDS